MKKRVGLWLDQQKAYIVALDERGQSSVYTLESNAESHHKSTGGGKSRSGLPFMTDAPVAGDRIKNRQQNQLKSFYHEIMDHLNDAQAIYIFGPGAAKLALEKLIRSDKSLAPKLKSVETTDSLTRNQIAARVRQYYAPKAA